MPKDLMLIAGDHAATDLKTAVMKEFTQYEWKDLGTTNTDSVDYPDYAAKACLSIQEGTAERAILICGSGIGMCITANKFEGIRAAVVESVESARLSREHNNANVLCLGARNLKPNLAFEIIQTWLTTPFSNSPRHIQRLQKIAALEEKTHKH